MTSVPSYLQKFSPIDQSDQFIFPRRLYEMSITQPLRKSKEYVIGQSYAARLNGYEPSLVDLAIVTIRFLLVEEADFTLLDMKQKLLSFGLGYLHYNDGRKALASLAEMPSVEITFNNPQAISIALMFDIWSDFE